MTYTVRYQIGTYSGQVEVNAENTDEAITKAKSKMRRNGWPIGVNYESWHVVGHIMEAK